MGETTGGMGRRGSLAAGVVLAVLVLIVAGVWWWLSAGDGGGKAGAVGGAGERTQPVAVEEPKAPARIKVGLMCSLYSATGPSWVGHPYGFGMHTDVARSLRDRGIEMYWIIEPGTEDQGALPEVLGRYPHAGVLNGADANDLRKLDVIMVMGCYNMRDEVLAAMEEAVRDGGVGLLCRGMGEVTPGYTPQVIRLVGMKDAAYGWKPGSMECTIVADHPLLGMFASQKGQTIQISPDGPFGVVNGTPIIQVNETSAVYRKGGQQLGAEAVSCPLYVSQLGKGKIVVCATADLPKVLGPRIYIQCIQWLTGRPVE